MWLVGWLSWLAWLPGLAASGLGCLAWLAGCLAWPGLAGWLGWPAGLVSAVWRGWLAGPAGWLGFWACFWVPPGLFPRGPRGPIFDPRKGPETLIIVQNSTESSFLGPRKRPGRPQNSNHSNIIQVEKRCFLAFGCDFPWEKCIEHRRYAGFEFCGNAKTLYSTYEIELFSTSSSAK